MPYTNTATATAPDSDQTETSTSPDTDPDSETPSNSKTNPSSQPERKRHGVVENALIVENPRRRLPARAWGQSFHNKYTDFA